MLVLQYFCNRYLANMDQKAFSLAKFFLYLAPVSFLIVASSMFFPFIVGKGIFFRVSVELALFFYLAFVLLNPTQSKLREIKLVLLRPLSVALFIFTALFLLASFTAENPQIAFWSNFERGEGALQMLHYAAFFWLTLLILKTKKEWHAFISWLLIIGLFVSLYAFGQRYGGPSKGFYGDGARASGTLGNPLYLSTFTFFLFLFAAWLFKESKTWLTRGLLLGFVVVEILAFFMAQSRNGTVGMAVGIITFVLYFAIKDRDVFIRKFNARWLAIVALALIFAFGAFFYLTRTKEMWKQVPGLNRFARENVLTGLDDRRWVWQSTFSAFAERPVLGWGPENFPIPFDKYYNPQHYGSDSWFDRAHSIYLEYLSYGGVLLFASYIALWIAFMWELFKRRSTLTPLSMALFIAFAVAYLMQGVSAFEVLPLYAMLFAFWAFVLRMTHDNHVKDGQNEPGRLKAETGTVSAGAVQYAVLSVAAMVVITSLYFANYLPLRKNLLLLRAASTRDSAEKAVANFSAVLNFYSPIGQQETVQYFLLFVVRLLEASAQNKALTENPQYARELVALAEDVYQKNEQSAFRSFGVKTLYYSALLHLRAAVIIQDAAMLDIAESKFRRGHEMAPKRFEFIYPLLDIAAIKNDRASGIAMITLARKLRPDLEQTARYEAFFGGMTATSSQ